MQLLTLHMALAAYVFTSRWSNNRVLVNAMSSKIIYVIKLERLFFFMHMSLASTLYLY